MAVREKTELGRSRLSFAREADIDEFVDMLGQFERGEITPDQWRSFRLLRGTYGQRQAEDAQMMRVKIPQGALTVAQLEALADVAERYSRGFGHITTRQNVQFHFVKRHEVELAMHRMAEAGMTTREACGNSRGLGRLLAAKLPELAIKISGCPNGCGQHHIGGIGFQGSLRKVGGRPAPHYFVLVGGGTTDGLTTFGRVAATVPARRAFEALERLTDLYVETRAPGESARTFFRRVDLPVAKAALAHLERLAPEGAVEEDFIDLGEDHAFKPEIMDGECSA